MKFYHWMPKFRISWPKYLLLKEGITKSSAMLYAYHFFNKYPKANVLIYATALGKELIKNGLIYFKHNLFGKSTSNESEVSMLILKVKFETFIKDFFRSIRHFNKLKRFI
jgi:hypothetical protein